MEVVPVQLLRAGRTGVGLIGPGQKHVPPAEAPGLLRRPDPPPPVQKENQLVIGLGVIGQIVAASPHRHIGNFVGKGQRRFLAAAVHNPAHGLIGHIFTAFFFIIPDLFLFYK